MDSAIVDARADRLSSIQYCLMQDISLRPAHESDWDFVAAVTEECMRVYVEQTWGNWITDSRSQDDPSALQIVRFAGHEAG